MNSLRINSALATMVFAWLALGGCTAEPLVREQRSAGQDETVNIDLLPPGGFEAYTRGMTAAQEGAVSAAVVLQFERTETAEKLVKWVDATVTTNGGKTTLTATLQSSLKETQRYDLVVIANTATTASFFATYADQTKEQVLAAFPTQTYTDKWATAPIPMWAEKTDMIVSPQSNLFTLPLLRSLARIDIGLGTYDAATGTWGGLTTAPHTFTLQKVYLFNVNNRFAALSAPANLNGTGRVTAPTVPAGTGLMATTVESAFDYSSEIVDGKQLSSAIYLPETDNKNTANKQQRTILVIGGSYSGGATTYYRIDLLDHDQNPVNVLRNHCYRFSVMTITKAGYATVQQALDKPAINEISDIVALSPIDEGEAGDVIFDKTSCLVVSNSELQVYADNSEQRTIELATVRADYPADVTPQISSTISGATFPALTSGVRVPFTVTFPANVAYGDYTCTITIGKLTKILKLRLQPGLDVHFDMLPFGNIANAEITSSDGTPGWIALSDERDYKPLKQYQSVSSNPNADGKLYVHIDENIAQPGAARTAIVQFTRKDGSGTLKAIFEQLSPAGLLLGYFGGDAWATDVSGYPKQLMAERVEEYRDRTYDDGSSETVIGMQWGFNKITTNVTDRSFGRAGTITLAKRADAGVSPPGLYPAKYCYDKNRDTNGNGIFEDNEIVWYLPAQNQLLSAWIVQAGLPFPFAANFYWSATENSSSSWYVLLTRGEMGSTGKIDVIRVRCVRDI